MPGTVSIANTTSSAYIPQRPPSQAPHRNSYLQEPHPLAYQHQE